MKNLIFLFVALTMTVSGQTLKVDPGIPSYVRNAGVSGSIKAIGSDALHSMMQLWADSFCAMSPNVKVQLIGKGSSTAPPALIQGISQIGPMSRKMRDAEEQAFEKQFGYKPTCIAVALDALAVFVHKDNPIGGLTIGQLDGIFSSTRSSGCSELITWGQVGLRAPFDSLPFSLYGRNSASGGYAFFKKNALCKGDFKASVREQPSSSVVDVVAVDKAAIGYSSIGCMTSAVNALALSKDGREMFVPSYENVLAGDYPLGRTLYVYINKPPGQPADPVVAEFLMSVLSQRGQKIVAEAGCLRLSATEVAKELAKLD